MPEPALAPGVTEDLLLGGAIRLRQPEKGHRAGTDAVLLASLAEAKAGERVVDLGSASGAVGLMIAARVPAARVLLVDRQPDLVALATQNIALNGLTDRMEALCVDAFASPAAWRDAGCRSGEADLVVTNPPWFGEGGRGSPDAGRRAAHVFAGGDLAGWLSAVSRLLGGRGRFALIHRADALADILSVLPAGFGSLVVNPIYPRHGTDASRIVVLARRGGRAALRIGSPLILHDPDGSFTPDASLLHSPD